MLAEAHPSVEAGFGLLGGGEDVCYCFGQLGEQSYPVKHLVLRRGVLSCVADVVGMNI